MRGSSTGTTDGRRRRGRTAAVCAVLLAAVLGTGAVPAGAAPGTAPAAGERGHEATQRALDVFTESGLPGVLARVDGPGGRSWTGRSGVADLRTERPRRDTDRFRMGSVTKTFTATLLLQLEARGALSLDDTVDHWLPGLVRGNGHDGRGVTLRQLLNHTSGVHNYTDDAEFQRRLGPGFPRYRYHAYTPRDLVAFAMRHRPVFPPGRGWKYSNTNYVLARMVIEKAGGASYAAQLRERVTGPLGLRGTSAPGHSPDLPGPHGRGYSKDAAGRIFDSTRQDPSWAGAAGDLVSTTRDLNRFYRALLSGRLLPPAQRAELLDGVRIDPRGRQTYGLGLQSRLLSCGVRTWEHSGGLHGSLTWTVSTADGGRQLTFNVNGDWLEREEPVVAVLETVFCPGGSRA
ncbi:serine hydrolase domain-containing protein [Streptomyces uncialis]|uniref:serine hydrolase domain-containing protein n=1 Tax=Streptomyces uncialis TaxID=1048205 RepID=UPI00386F054E|nr:beta-lactamase family protein [Streptomyces uncialis]